MESEIWKVDYRKAFSVGYSADGIKLFCNEAELLLRQLTNYFDTLSFSIDKQDRELLSFLILNELLNSLYDAIEELKKGNIRMAGRVFRDVMENRYIIKLINLENGEKHISKWFEDEIIQNSLYRNELKKVKPDLATLTAEIYKKFSKFAHRSYSVLIDNYTNEEGKLHFNRRLQIDNDEHRKIISKYAVHSAQFILDTGYDPIDYDLLSKDILGMMVSH